MENFRKPFAKIYDDLYNHGERVSPRGQLVLEIQNYNYTLPPYVRFAAFADRKLNIPYLKREFLWYLRGDAHDLSITKYAKIWADIVNDDGTLNSNYGQYIFGKQNQFDNVVKILREDRDSRRASIVILNHEHLIMKTKDVPCTYSINFRIRDNKLNMSVHMRSQDAVFGMGNDAPTFSFIHEMMLNALREFYPTLEYGDYYHCVDSFHIYERHFGMLEKIASGDAKFDIVECPKISGPKEVSVIRSLPFDDNYSNIPDFCKFSKWLIKS